MFLFLLGIYLGVNFLDHMVTLFFKKTIWGIAKLFSKVAALFNIPFPSSVEWGFQFFYIFANACDDFKNSIHFSQCEVAPHHGFDLHFLND